MRGLMAAGTGIILLPISVIGMLMLAFGSIASLYMAASFLFLPASVSLGPWLKCVAIALIGLAILWAKSRMLGAIAGNR